MTNWYTSREALKDALDIVGIHRNRAIDRTIEAVCREIDRACHRWFIPRTQTRLYRWPPHHNGPSYMLWLDADLLSITTLQSQAQDSSPTTIAATDYFLEPANEDRFNRVEIDLSSSAAFQSGNTPQRSISIAGSWGWSSDTDSAGTVDDSGGISASDTTLVVSNASLIDVGDTILVESEQIFVSDRDFAARGSILTNDASITASQANVSITVDGAHGIVAGEVIRLDSEMMYVVSVSGNVLTVIRAWDGSLLAAHANDLAVHINRTLTIERGANGTTAATHADTTAITKYVVQADIREWALAEAIAKLSQERAAWGRTIGSGESAKELTGRDLGSLRKSMKCMYTRHRPMVAV